MEVIIARLLCILVLLSEVVCAADRFVVSGIDIEGLKRTRRWVILKELEFQVGDTIAAADLTRAEQRLLNLTFLNAVTVSADGAGRVRVDLREAWPILPAISVQFTEGSLSDVLKYPRTFFDKTTVYAGLGHLNFHGDGGQVLAYAQFGAAQGFALQYHTRWLAPRWPVAMDAEFYNLRASDREWTLRDSTAYIRDAGYQITLATRSGAASRIGARVQYRGIIKEALLPDQPRRTRTVWFSPFVMLDHRDLEWYPTRGAFARMDVNFAAGDADFVRSQYDLRGYFPLSRRHRPPVLAMRFNAATSTSSTPGWANYYWGFLSSFRGYTGVKSRSLGYLIGDVELRFPISREFTYTIPHLGSYGERWPFGISGVLFIERAELSFDGKRQERAAAGGGLHFRVPYVQILEIAVAVNRDGESEYNITTDVRF